MNASAGKSKQFVLLMFKSDDRGKNKYVKENKFIAIGEKNEIVVMMTLAKDL